MASRSETTDGSSVLEAAGKDSPASQAALAQLFEAFWYRIHAFIRRQGDLSEAEDLRPAYFARFLEKGACRYDGIVHRLGVAGSAVRVALHRLRRRFGTLLRGEIARTVSKRREVDEEIGISSRPDYLATRLNYEAHVRLAFGTVRP
jgi:hypothetical protein